MLRSLVGSEMCIRDRDTRIRCIQHRLWTHRIRVASVSSTASGYTGYKYPQGATQIFGVFSKKLNPSNFEFGYTGYTYPVCPAPSPGTLDTRIRCIQYHVWIHWIQVSTRLPTKMLVFFQKIQNYQTSSLDTLDTCARCIQRRHWIHLDTCIHCILRIHWIHVSSVSGAAVLTTILLCSVFYSDKNCRHQLVKAVLINSVQPNNP